MQLIMPDVNTHHMRRAALQKTISKTACGLPDIEAAKMCHIQANMRQRSVQLEPAARHETIQITRFDFYRNVCCDGDARLAQRNAKIALAREHMARCNQPLRRRSRRRKATLNEQHISTHEYTWMKLFGLFAERNDHGQCP